MKSIFIAFIGSEIEQDEKIFDIQDGYECWNLKKFNFEEFLEKIKERIPPINDKVLRNYRAEDGKRDMCGITEKQLAQCSWGLLIPDSSEDPGFDCYSETIYLLNLYSPEFLYPKFYASDFGIRPQDYQQKDVYSYAHYQNQSTIFKRKEFVNFFKILLPQAQYGAWEANRSQNWKEEDWRLYVASLLFFGLQDYDNHKSSFTWQRESADMGAVLESLFTARDTTTEEIGYRLRKRVAVLLSFQFPNIENDIKELYEHRSAFVHGSFFAQISKASKNALSSLPVPDFDLLYKQREYVRWALVLYIHLAQTIKLNPEEYQNKKLIQLLEQAIIDTTLRDKLLVEVKKIVAFMSPV